MRGVGVLRSSDNSVTLVSMTHRTWLHRWCFLLVLCVTVIASFPGTDAADVGSKCGPALFQSPGSKRNTLSQAIAAHQRTGPLPVPRVGRTSSSSSSFPDASQSGQQCNSSLGMVVSWSWQSESQGVVTWKFENTANETLTVVLNRGAQNEVSSYCFGGAFFAAYIVPEIGLAYIGSGPYSPMSGALSTLPLALVDDDPSRGICFVFTVATGDRVEVSEGGFSSSSPPFCTSIPDLQFQNNTNLRLDYQVSSQCEQFYSQTGLPPPYCCPANPIVTKFPVYTLRDGSMSGQFGPQQGDTITLNVQGDSSPTSNLSCPSSTHDTTTTTSLHCFPGDATVRLPGGVIKRMHELAVGDSIETLALDTRTHTYRRSFTTVYAFVDRVAEARSLTYIQVQVSGAAAVLELTPEHLLPVAPADIASHSFVPANAIRAGMRVRRHDGTWGRVEHVRHVVRDGAYAPLTHAGTLVVNGVWVSCYGHTASHRVAHWAFAPLRLYARLQRLRPALSAKPTASIPAVGLHRYAQFLLAWRRLWHST
ncbi:hypothetical protein CDCA_CDCA01G0096 [Cyanidium caldarium]|uniref:Hint domain-containing protein n=1 Tax=Cyanidium caldarium TaxID=2771 RepID=A0AAV9IPQ7_CYACA|nr:hypothetical protein CDCA_CDCA01G0096 [Cyanidium caldarium]